MTIFAAIIFNPKRNNSMAHLNVLDNETFLDQFLLLLYDPHLGIEASLALCKPAERVRLLLSIAKIALPLRSPSSAPKPFNLIPTLPLDDISKPETHPNVNDDDTNDDDTNQVDIPQPDSKDLYLLDEDTQQCRFNSAQEVPPKWICNYCNTPPGSFFADICNLCDAKKAERIAMDGSLQPGFCLLYLRQLFAPPIKNNS
jgi:hypothetical protein